MTSQIDLCQLCGTERQADYVLRTGVSVYAICRACLDVEALRDFYAICRACLDRWIQEERP